MTRRQRDAETPARAADSLATAGCGSRRSTAAGCDNFKANTARLLVLLDFHDAVRRVARVEFPRQ